MIISTIMLALVVISLFFGLEKKGLSVIEINCTPKEYYDKLPSILPQEKLNRKYRFVYTAENYDLDSKVYLTEHPEDAVEKSYAGDGKYLLLVFSNNGPDPKFFQ